jgi:hypothetical protein
LKFLPTIVLTEPFSSVGIGADFKKGLASPEAAFSAKALRASEDRS